MGKPNGHPLKDVTMKKSNESLITCQSSKATNENVMFNLDLNLAANNPEANDMKDLARKGKFTKIEPLTVTAFKNTRRAKLEPGFKIPSSSYESASRLSLGSSSRIKIERGKSSGLRFRQQPAARGSAPESSTSSGHGSVLIAMSCLTCYMHVMVCDTDRRCPKCRRGDGLLDIYRNA